MTTPADTPVPRHLSEEERALWEKASAAFANEPESWYAAADLDITGYYTSLDFIAECSPSVILSLLTALSKEREALREYEREFGMTRKGRLASDERAQEQAAAGRRSDAVATSLENALAPQAGQFAAIVKLRDTAAPSTETPNA